MNPVSGQVLLELVILALPVAAIAWTVTHEELFRELHDYCVERSRVGTSIWRRPKDLLNLRRRPLVERISGSPCKILRARGDPCEREVGAPRPQDDTSPVSSGNRNPPRRPHPERTAGRGSDAHRIS